MQDNEEISKHLENALQSVEMLRAVIGGETYEAVAVRFGVSRTAVERRIKSVAVQLTQVVGVDGLKEEGAAFVRRLRLHRDAILVALEGLRAPAAGRRPSGAGIVGAGGGPGRGAHQGPHQSHLA
jgi:hypothetical protein